MSSSKVGSRSRELIARYTEAVFGIARAQNSLDQVASDLKQMKQLLIDNTAFNKTIHSPILTKDVLSNLMQEICKKFGFSALTKGLLMTLACNRRLALIQEIADEFASYLITYNNEIKVEIAIATPWNQAQISSITTLLENSLKRKVISQLSITPEILGGFIIRINSLMLDGSLAHKLKKLKSISAQADALTN